jgi:hypothetical protein
MRILRWRATPSKSPNCKRALAAAVAAAAAAAAAGVSEIPSALKIKTEIQYNKSTL